jgi:hypothetical protein
MCPPCSLLPPCIAQHRVLACLPLSSPSGCPPYALLSPPCAEEEMPACPPCLDNQALSPACPPPCNENSISFPSTENDALLSPRAEEEKDAVSSVHARNRVLSPRAEEAEEDAEDASTPCGLLSSCAEEDMPPSAFNPCGLLSPATEEDMQRTLLHSIWGLSRPLWRARRWMLALLVTTLVTIQSRKESPKHSIMIILSPLLSSLSLSLWG